MSIQDNFLTGIQHDWTQDNLAALQETLAFAYQDIFNRANLVSDPAFATPNRIFLMGVMRWFFVDSYLERACKLGKLKGITPVWVRLSEGSGGIAALELRGAYTSLSAHHLQHPDDPLRDSTLRFEKRLSNYQNPMLPSDDFKTEADADDSLINVTLVHGDKSAEFAFLRVYNNPDNLRSYLAVSDNLMKMLTLITPVEVETIAEPSVDLQPHLLSKEIQKISDV